MSNALNRKIKPVVADDQTVTLEGTPAADLLVGNGLDNILSGKGGADTLKGLAGNDEYRVDNPHDVIIEYKGAGIDVVVTAVEYTLPGNVENLRLTGKDSVFATGNELNNIIMGNSGDNRLDGADGVDTVSYRLAGGPVRVNLSTEDPQQTGSAGTDTLLNFEQLEGSKHNDYLIGSAESNTLIGGGGADTLQGEAGSDRLIGGPGRDCFVLCHPDGTDRIVDFTAGVDRICIDQTLLPVGDGDDFIEQDEVVRGLGGFSPKSEWVRFATHLNGPMDTESAAALIRGADKPFDLGQTALFVLDNEVNTAIFYFKSSNVNSRVSESELKLIGVVSGTALQLSDVGLI